MRADGEPAGVAIFHRPVRSWPEPVPTAPVVVAAPPMLNNEQNRPLMQILLPLAGSVGVIALAFAIQGIRFLIVSACIAVLTIVMSLLVVRHQKRAARVKRARTAELYRAYLDARRERLDQVAAAQRHAAARLHPDPERLATVASTRAHLWERRLADEDFLEVRLGLGSVRLASPVTLDLGGDPLAEYHADLLGEAKELVADYERLAPMPVTAPLSGLGSVAVVGDRAAAQGFARAICCQLAVWHSPDDLRLAAWFEPGQEAAWDWMKWLPHARDHSAAPGEDAGQAVALTVDVADLEVLLSRLVTPRLEHLDRAGKAGLVAPPVAFQPVVLLLDGYDPAAPVGRLPLVEQLFERAADLGILVIALAANPDRAPSRVGAVAELSADGRLAWTEAGPRGRRERNLHADSIAPGRCEATARALAPLFLRARRERAATVDTQGLLDLLELGAPGALELATTRPARAPEKLLATVIGIGDDAAPVTLDLKEAAEGGMGPHGLVVGATGSGKSELLRTLVAGLACTHTPEELALVLVDYKGGATFAELGRLPHVAGVITNLERDPALVDRMHEALFGELDRRQRVLAEAGLDHVRDYQHEWHLRAARGEVPGRNGFGNGFGFGNGPGGGGLREPLPSLLVIVDEFGELLTARPDFIDLFVSVGRLGRSLGIHLLLSTQRLDEGRIRGLDSNLRYRVCLRTFSPEESLTALGTRDAFDLPPLPGLGYLKVDTTMRRFKAALATRPYREQRTVAQEGGVVRAFDIGPTWAELAVVGEAGLPKPPLTPPVDPGLGAPLLDLAVLEELADPPAIGEGLCAHGRPLDRHAASWGLAGPGPGAGCDCEPQEQDLYRLPAPDERPDRPATRAGAGNQPTGRGVDSGDGARLVGPAGAGSGAPDPARRDPRGGPAGTGRVRTDLQVAVEALATAARGRRVRQVWLPPLPAALTLGAVLDTVDRGGKAPPLGTGGGGEPATAGGGTPGMRGGIAAVMGDGSLGAVPGAPPAVDRHRSSPDGVGNGWLRVPLGLLDLPRDQAQLPFVLDFNGIAGHLAVVGAPRSGKSTLLQTLIAALALTHDPAEAQVYAADFGGGRLHALAGLPHVGAVYGRGDREALRRLVRELRALVDERAAAFRRHRLDGMAAYHAARAAGAVEAEYGEVLLVVDNWGLFVTELPELSDQVQELAVAGLHYGVHLVLAANRWNDLRLTLRDNIGGRLELRLNDPVESEIDRHASRSLPADQPGRGLAPGGERFQAALPRIDGIADIGGLSHGIETLVAQVGAWHAGAPAAPEIRMLPDEVAAASLPDPAADRDPGVAVGLEEFGLRPARVDLFGGEPHFLVLGDGESGKTTLLRGLLRGLVTAHGPERARVAVVDYRRQLFDEVAGPHNAGYAYTPGMTTTLVTRLTEELSARMPESELTASALRQPRTWSGPALVLVVDDYDLVASAVNNPLAGLADLLAQGRDIGFHLVLARRVGGFARSAFEPVLQRLRELTVPGLILSGDPQEGPLLGGVKAGPALPGRGHLVRDRADVLIQVARFRPRAAEARQGHEVQQEAVTRDVGQAHAGEHAEREDGVQVAPAGARSLPDDPPDGDRGGHVAVPATGRARGA